MTSTPIKYLAATAMLALTVFATYNIKPKIANAQSASLSGQYGCVLNKNFGGYTTELNGNSYTSNFLMYIDFSGNTFQRQIAGVTNFNQSTANVSYSNQTGSITVASGPVTNSYTVSGTYQSSVVMGITVVSVNGGNTLLVSESATSDIPTTGVCQKV